MEWYDAVYDTNDFVLDVNFTAQTISTAGVNARRKRVAGGYIGDLDWILQGRYDASGIITGIIKNTAENLTRIGTLTGLIGVEGAVATFLIDEEAGSGQNISFVGGFVAAPVGTISGTSYTHFDLYHKAQTDQRQLYTDLNLASGGPAGLLVATATSFDTAGATGFTLGTGGFQRIYYLDGGSSGDSGGLRTGTDIDGFAILRGRHSSTVIYRAGILAGTDLGSSVNADLAPASADATALWTGIGYVIHSSNTASKTEPFATEALNFSVDFVNGTIRTVANSIGDSGEFGAVVGAANRFGVRGTFGGALPPGILGGTVTYGLAEDDTEDSIMELSGLIGRDGAIGVFANEASASLRYAGGFSARPFALTPAAATDTAPTVVDVDVLPDYPDFAKDVLTPAGTSQGGFLKTNAEDFGVYQPTTAYSTHTRNFERANPTGGAWVNLPTAFGLVPNSVVTLRNDIDFDGGVGYFYIQDDNESIFYYYAGILADTDLGAPRTETEGTAIWPGRFIDELIKDHADKDNFVDFHIDFGRGELQFRNPASTAGGYTLAYGTNRYTLNGIFGNRIIDKNGNILTTGQLGGQITRVSTISGSQVAPITGLIGEKGVVGAFVNSANLSGFAGGFWAVPELAEPVDLNDKLVNFADWSDPFGRATPPPTKPSSPSKSEFLTGNAAVTVIGGPNEIELDGSGLNEPTNVSPCCALGDGRARFALTFGNATYDGKPLGGAGTAADGVAGFATTGPSSSRGHYRYAGLLSGTDLGAPISANTPVGAWKGRFVGIRRGTSSSLFRTIRDFTLNVTYNGTGGGTLTMFNAANTPNSTITDSLTSTSYYEMVNGAYDASGVISGKINFRHVQGDDDITVEGILTGLIGVDGAVGAFISGTGTIKSIGEYSNTVRAFGGFVAGPAYVPPMGTTAFLLENALDGDGASMTIPTVAGTNLYNFITAGATELTLTNATNKSAVKLGDLDGNDNSASGFAIETTSPGGVTRRHVGILDGTDVGAPLTLSANITADWTGLLSIQTETLISAKAITLNVGFDGTTGTITTQHGGFYYDTTGGSADPNIVINGKFGANGVIYGTTSATNTSAPLSTVAIAGTLTGLIGVNGAVAVFAGNNGGGNYGYAGGFVATPKPSPACATTNCVDYADWATTTTPDVVNGFVTEHKFATSAGSAVLTNQLVATSTSVYDTSAGGDVSDGFGYYHSSGYYYVGILATTNLGAPLDMTTAEGIWSGEVTLAESDGSIATVETHDFTLGVTFGATSSGNAGSVDSGAIGTTDITFAGEFDANGVITGTTASTANGAGVVQGLIGAEGAVGAFHSTKTGNGAYAGGFIAKPTEPDVSYAAWESSFDTGGVNADQTLQDSGFTNAVRGTSDYIKLDGDTKIVTSAGTFTPNILRLNETVGEPGYESGIAYRNVSVTGSLGQTYAGILPTTNLGAPLVDGSKDGTWTGRLEGITGFAEPSLALDTFSMKVTWTGNGGTIKSLDGDGDVGFAPVGGFDKGMKFTGDFNALGVMWGDVKANINDVDPDNGTFSGLIGAKGAVGVFEGVTGVFSYGGGFVVQPPSN